MTEKQYRELTLNVIEILKQLEEIVRNARIGLEADLLVENNLEKEKKDDR